MKPALKPPGTERLKLTYDERLLNFAFKFKLRRYTLAGFFLAKLRDGRPPELNDLATLDPELYRNLLKIKQYPADQVEDLFLFFTVGRCRFTLSNPS
jgi:hypothetical protein